MEELKFKTPEDIEIKNVDIDNKNHWLIAEYVFNNYKFGDYVELDMVFPNFGIILSKLDSGNYKVLGVNNIQYNDIFPENITKASKFGCVAIDDYLSDNNLMIDYELQKVVKKRWRAEKDETFYCVTSCGIVLETRETYNEDDNMLFNSGNYFQTKEQAENAAKEIKNFLKKYTSNE